MFVKISKSWKAIQHGLVLSCNILEINISICGCRRYPQWKDRQDWRNTEYDLRKNIKPYKQKQTTLTSKIQRTNRVLKKKCCNCTQIRVSYIYIHNYTGFCLATIRLDKIQFVTFGMSLSSHCEIMTNISEIQWNASITKEQCFSSPLGQFFISMILVGKNASKL